MVHLYANITVVFWEDYKLSGGDLRLDPSILLTGNGDRFACRTRKNDLQGFRSIILLAHNSTVWFFSKPPFDSMQIAPNPNISPVRHSFTQQRAVKPAHPHL